MDVSPHTEAGSVSVPSPSWRWLRQRTTSEGQQSLASSSHTATPSSDSANSQMRSRGEAYDASPSSTHQTTPEVGSTSPSGSSFSISAWSRNRSQKAKLASPLISGPAFSSSFSSSSSYSPSTTIKDSSPRPLLHDRTDSSGSVNSAKARRVLMPNIPQRKTSSSAIDTLSGSQSATNSPSLGHRGGAGSSSSSGSGPDAGGMSPSPSQTDIKSIAQAIAARAQHVAAANAKRAAESGSVSNKANASNPSHDPRSISSASGRSEDVLGITSDKSDASTPKARTFDQTAQTRRSEAQREKGEEEQEGVKRHKGNSESFTWADGDWADFSDVLRENIDFGGREETLASPIVNVASPASRHSKSDTMSSISTNGRDMRDGRRPSGSGHSHGTSQTSAPEELPYLHEEAQAGSIRQRNSAMSSSTGSSSKWDSSSTQDSDGNSKMGDYDDVRFVTATKQALSKQSVPPPRDAVGTINIGLGIGGADFPTMSQVTTLRPSSGQGPDGVAGNLSLRGIDNYATAPESVSPSSFTMRTPPSNPVVSPSSTSSPATPWSSSSLGIKRKGRPAALSLNSSNATNLSSPMVPGTPSRAILQSPVVRGRTPPPTQPPTEPLPPLPPTPSTYSGAVLAKKSSKNNLLSRVGSGKAAGASGSGGGGQTQRSEERRGSDPEEPDNASGVNPLRRASDNSNSGGNDARLSSQSSRSHANGKAKVVDVGATPTSSESIEPLSSVSSPTDANRSATAAVVAGSHLQTRAGSQRAQAMLSTMVTPMTFDEKRASMGNADREERKSTEQASKSLDAAFVEVPNPATAKRKQVPRVAEPEIPSLLRTQAAEPPIDEDEQEHLDNEGDDVDDETTANGENDDDDDEDAVSDSEPETAVVKVLTRLGSISERKSAQAFHVSRTGSVMMGESSADRSAPSPSATLSPPRPSMPHSHSSPELLQTRQGPTNEVLAGLEKMNIVGRVRASIEKRSPSASEVATLKTTAVEPELAKSEPVALLVSQAAADRQATNTERDAAPSSPSTSTPPRSRDASSLTHPPSAWGGVGKRSPKPGHTQNNASTSSQISIGLAQQAKNVSLAESGGQTQANGGSGSTQRLSQQAQQGMWTPRQFESPEAPFSGALHSSGIETPSMSGHGDANFPDSASSNGHVIKRRSSTVQSRRGEMYDEKRTESSLSAYSERIKRAEGRFAGAFGEIAVAFKNLQAEKKTLERIIRATTPLDGVNDSEGLRTYLSSMSYKLEMSASEIRKLLDLLDQQRSVMDYMLETHQLETDSHLDEIDDLQDELDNMTAEAEMHHTNATKLTTDVEKAYAEGVAARAETLRYKTMMIEEESKREKLSSTIKALRDEVAGLQSKAQSEEALHASTKERLRDVEEQHAKIVDGLGTGDGGAAEDLHATNVKTMQDRISSLEKFVEQHETQKAERERTSREQDEELQTAKRNLADAHKLHESRQREVYDELEESRRAHDETKGDLQRLSNIMTSSGASSSSARAGQSVGDDHQRTNDDEDRAKLARKHSSDSDSTNGMTDLSNKLEESEREKDALRDQVVQQEKDIAELRASIALRAPSSPSTSPDGTNEHAGVIPPGRADQIEALMKQLSQQRSREVQIRTAYKQLRDELRKVTMAQQLDRKRSQASYSILGPPPSAASAASASSLTNLSQQPFTPPSSYDRMASGTPEGSSDSSTSRHLKRLSLPMATFPVGGLLAHQQHAADGASSPNSAGLLSSPIRTLQDNSGVNGRALQRKRANRHASVDPTNNLWATIANAGDNANPQSSPTAFKRRSSAFGIGTIPVSKSAQSMTSAPSISTSPTSAEQQGSLARPGSSTERDPHDPKGTSEDQPGADAAAAATGREEDETIESLVSPRNSVLP